MTEKIYLFPSYYNVQFLMLKIKRNVITYAMVYIYNGTRSPCFNSYSLEWPY